MSTTIYIDSRKRVAGDDASFEIDIGETLHLQTGAKLSVFKLRVADAFLSTDRGQYLLDRRGSADPQLGGAADRSLHGDAAGRLDQQQLRLGHLYVESTNEITVAYDGNRRILNDYEIRSLFPGTGSYPAGATSSRPLSINHLLGPSFIEGALQYIRVCHDEPL